MYKDKLTLLGTEIKPGDSICLQFDVAKLHTRNSIQVPIFIERAKKDGPVLLLLGGGRMGVSGVVPVGVSVVASVASSNAPQQSTAHRVVGWTGGLPAVNCWATAARYTGNGTPTTLAPVEQAAVSVRIR